MNTIQYTVDGEPQSTSEHQLTASQILKVAGKEPSSYYLILLEGNAQKYYQGRPDEIIHMHPKMRFISMSLAPTPVS